MTQNKIIYDGTGVKFKRRNDPDNEDITITTLETNSKDLSTDLKHAIYFDPELNGEGYDLTGNSTVTLHNYGNSSSYLKGSTSDGIRFPASSIPTNFTIITVSKYAGDSNRRRMFDSTTANWIHGHHAGHSGVALYGNTNEGGVGWTSGSGSSGPAGISISNGDWLIMGGQNKPSDSKVMINGEIIDALKNGGSGNLQLSINDGVENRSQFSDWEVQQVLIWNTHLEPEEFKTAYDIINAKRTPNINNDWILSTELSQGDSINNPWTGETTGLYTASMSGAYMNNQDNVIGYPSQTEPNKYIFAFRETEHIKMVSVIIENGVEVSPKIREAKYTYTGSTTTLTVENVNNAFYNGYDIETATSLTENGYYVYNIQVNKLQTPVRIPLNTLSNNNGEDLEIKIEWDNNDGTTSHRFYKGWRLDEIFDNTRTSALTLGHTVYGKLNESDDWTSASMAAANININRLWNFHTDQAGSFRFDTQGTGLGFLLQTPDGDDKAKNIYSGNGYQAYSSWSKLRVYARRVLPQSENLIGWYHASTFPHIGTAGATDADGTPWVNSSPATSGKLAAATVSKGTVTHIIPENPEISQEGLSFDRSLNQYADMGTTQFGESFTISVWVNVHSYQESQGIYTFATDVAYPNNNSIGLSQWGPTEKLSPGIYDGDDATMSTFTRNILIANVDNVPLDLNEWMHLTFVSDTSSRYYLYKNGVDTNMNADYWNDDGVQTSFADSRRFARILERNISTIGSASFDGQIKSLNIWERALSSEEILDLYERDMSYRIRVNEPNHDLTVNEESTMDVYKNLEIDKGKLYVTSGVVIRVSGGRSETENFDGFYIKNGQQRNGFDVWENKEKGFFLYVEDYANADSIFWMFNTTIGGWTKEYSLNHVSRSHYYPHNLPKNPVYISSWSWTAEQDSNISVELDRGLRGNLVLKNTGLTLTTGNYDQLGGDVTVTDSNISAKEGHFPELDMYNGNLSISPGKNLKIVNSSIILNNSDIISVQGDNTTNNSNSEITNCNLNIHGNKLKLDSGLDSGATTALTSQLKHAIYFDPKRNKSGYDLTGNSRVTLHNCTDYLKGTTTDGIRFPENSIPENFTIITVSRFGVPRTSATTDGGNRIFDGVNKNWLHGQYDNFSGFAHYDEWIAYPHSGVNERDNRKDAFGYTDGEWLIMGGQNKTESNFLTIDGENNLGEWNSTQQGSSGSFTITNFGTRDGVYAYYRTETQTVPITNFQSTGVWKNDDHDIFARDNDGNWVSFMTTVESGNVTSFEVSGYPHASNRNGTYAYSSNLGSQDFGNGYQTQSSGWTNNTFKFVKAINTTNEGPQNLWVNFSGAYDALYTLWDEDDTYPGEKSSTEDGDIDSRELGNSRNAQRHTITISNLSQNTESGTSDQWVYKMNGSDKDRYPGETITLATLISSNDGDAANFTLTDLILSLTPPKNGGEGNVQLAINDGMFGDSRSTDWEVQQVLIWDTHLEPNEFKEAYSSIHAERKPETGYDNSVINPETAPRWRLSTEISNGQPINNPWTGEGEDGAPPVRVPLNTLSNNHGTDLEIKMEIDVPDGTTITRFYKGWHLDDVFDYNVRCGGGACSNEGRIVDGKSVHEETLLSYKNNESDRWESSLGRVEVYYNWGWIFKGQGDSPPTANYHTSYESYGHGMILGKDGNNFDTVLVNGVSYENHTIRVYVRDDWRLSTEISNGQPINNPWTGEGEDGAPPVRLPLNTLSNNYGTDLEIKMEMEVASVYDNDGVHDITFTKSFNARYVRLHPENWAGDPSPAHIAMRMDVYVDGEIQSTPEANRSYTSTFNNGTPSSMLDGAVGWLAGTNNKNQWIKLDLGEVKNVTGVKVLKRPTQNTDQRVTQFRLEYSTDDTFWTTPYIQTFTRFYKGWHLDDVFDYDVRCGGYACSIDDRIVNGHSVHEETVLSYKNNESDPWESDTGNVVLRYKWPWIFTGTDKDTNNYDGASYDTGHGSHGMIVDKDGNNFGDAKAGPSYSEYKIRVYVRDNWILSTELTQGESINNPWNGDRSDASAPKVIVPLHTLSNSNNGQDLEIRIEWDNHLVHKVRIEGNSSENTDTTVNKATVRFSDIKIFDENDVNQISPTSTITQFDNSFSYDAYKAIDGNATTYNTNGEAVSGSGKWIEVTLDTPSKVSKIELTHQPGHNAISAPHAQPTRIKFKAYDNSIIKSIPINTWPETETHTIDYNPNIGVNESLSTRFYKGWNLNEVFDYGNPTISTGHTIYGKLNESDDWTSAEMADPEDNDNRLWNFHTSYAGDLKYTSGGKGFILHRDTTSNHAVKIFSDSQQSFTSWSKIRVYARPVQFPKRNNLVGWYHASTFPNSGTIGTHWINSAPSIDNKLGPAKVTRGTVTNINTAISNEGLTLQRSLSQYASLHETNIGGTLTFAMWVNVTNLIGSYQGFFAFSSGQYAIDAIEFVQILDQGKGYMNIKHGGAYMWGSEMHDDHGLTYTTGEWNHFVIVLDENSSEVNFYKNGVLNSTHTTTDFPNLMTRDNNYIGNSAGSSHLDGQIKSLNIWERALSAGEIAGLYQQGKNYPILSLRDPIQRQTALKHAIYFDENTARDLTGNSTVTLHGDTTPTVDANGLNLDRSLNQYADLGTTNIGGTLTFAVWSKNHIDIADFERLFDFSNTSEDRITLYYNKNDPRSIEGQLGDNYDLRIGDIADNHDKSWKHTVWVIDQTSAKQYLYRNGSLVVDNIDTNRQVPTANIPSGFTQQIQRTINHIGASSDFASTKFFDGQIKSLNIWERALSAEEIAGLYNEGQDYKIIKSALTFDGNSTITGLYPNPYVGQTYTLGGCSYNSGSNWNHIVITYGESPYNWEPGQSISFYINGQLYDDSIYHDEKFADFPVYSGDVNVEIGTGTLSGKIKSVVFYNEKILGYNENDDTYPVEDLYDEGESYKPNGTNVAHTIYFDSNGVNGNTTDFTLNDGSEIVTNNGVTALNTQGAGPSNFTVNMANMSSYSISIWFSVPEIDTPTSFSLLKFADNEQYIDHRIYHDTNDLISHSFTKVVPKVVTSHSNTEINKSTITSSQLNTLSDIITTETIQSQINGKLDYPLPIRLNVDSSSTNYVQASGIKTAIDQKMDSSNLNDRLATRLDNLESSHYMSSETNLQTFTGTATGSLTITTPSQPNIQTELNTLMASVVYYREAGLDISGINNYNTLVTTLTSAQTAAAQVDIAALTNAKTTTQLDMYNANAAVSTAQVDVNLKQAKVTKAQNDLNTAYSHSDYTDLLTTKAEYEQAAAAPCAMFATQPGNFSAWSQCTYYTSLISVKEAEIEAYESAHIDPLILDLQAEQNELNGLNTVLNQAQATAATATAAATAAATALQAGENTIEFVNTSLTNIRDAIKSYITSQQETNLTSILSAAPALLAKMFEPKDYLSLILSQDGLDHICGGTFNPGGNSSHVKNLIIPARISNSPNDNDLEMSLYKKLIINCKKDTDVDFLNVGTNSTSFWNVQANDDDHVSMTLKWSSHDGNDKNIYVILDGGNVGYFENNYGDSQRDHYIGNMFTGQHRCLPHDKNLSTQSYGLIVCSSGEYINIDNSIQVTMNESLPICKLCTTEKDKTVFGVISDAADDNEDREYKEGTFVSIYKKTNINEKRLHINSLGEGGVWICDKNGPIENGDYITTSSVCGYGEKQDELYVANYTVASITCDCDFSLEKIPKRKVKVNGFEVEVEANPDMEPKSSEESQDDNSEPEPKPESEPESEPEPQNPIMEYRQELVYDENGGIQYEDDLDEEGKQQMVYKFDTRFLDSNGDILLDETEYNTRKANGENVYVACFVGCTYHCG